MRLWWYSRPSEVEPFQGVGLTGSPPDFLDNSSTYWTTRGFCTEPIKGPVGYPIGPVIWGITPGYVKWVVATVKLLPTVGKIAKLPGGDKSVGSVADFDIRGLEFADRPSGQSSLPIFSQWRLRCVVPSAPPTHGWLTPTTSPPQSRPTITCCVSRDGRGIFIEDKIR